jgi:hypothetical protein
MEETWKDVVGYEGLYQVSDLGRIKSLPKYHYKDERILRPTLNKRDKRYTVLLTKDGEHKRIFVHRIVALSFVNNPNPERFTEINHKDENPRNNNASNLEWCDRWYNMHYNNLQDRISRGRKRIKATSKDGDVIIFNSLKEADKRGYSRRIIADIINRPGHRRQGSFFKGFYWEVVNGKN